MTSIEEPKDVTDGLDQLNNLLEETEEEDYIIDYGVARQLYKPDGVRKQIGITISKEGYAEWKDFIISYSGAPYKRGRGISSRMLEFSMRLLMSIVAGFKITRTVTDFIDLVPASFARKQIAENLREIARRIDPVE